MERTSNASEKVMQDLRAVVTDTEDLLKATAGDASERVATARARAETSLRNARTRLVEVEQRVAARARAVTRATDGYVHENPWPAIGVAAGVGFMIGTLLSRR